MRERRQRKRESILIQQKQIEAQSKPCENGNHAFMANLCQNCQIETICRNCKMIEDDKHICKLCSISFFQMRQDGRSGTLFSEPDPDAFTKVAGVEKCEDGSVLGFDKVAHLLEISEDTVQKHEETIQKVKTATSDNYVVIQGEAAFGNS